MHKQALPLYHFKNNNNNTFIKCDYKNASTSKIREPILINVNEHKSSKTAPSHCHTSFVGHGKEQRLWKPALPLQRDRSNVVSNVSWRSWGDYELEWTRGQLYGKIYGIYATPNGGVCLIYVLIYV